MTEMRGCLRIPSMYVTDELVQIINEETPEVDMEENYVYEFSSNQCAEGEFPKAEAYCRLKEIPFDRFSEGSYEFDPCTEYFRPKDLSGESCSHTTTCNVNEVEQIPVPLITQLTNRIFENELSKEDTLNELNNLLKKYSSTSIRPLKTYF